jgi:hypothetical protein
MTQFTATTTTNKNPVPQLPKKLIDLRQLDKRCSMTFDDYCAEARANGGQVIDCPDGQRYIFYDRGGKLLAAAHLDTVAVAKHRGTYKPSKADQLRYYAIELDDRLGAYILLDVLPKLGIDNYDILLTEGEESGRSTARWFDAPEGRYNWIFEFDRAGTDVVLYDYEDDDTLDLLWSYGWYVGWGAFSDICYLDHLEVKAFNFGCGYYNQHTDNCHMIPGRTKACVRRFVKFWHDMQNTCLPHVDESEHVSADDGYDYSSYYAMKGLDDIDPRLFSTLSRSKQGRDKPKRAKRKKGTRRNGNSYLSLYGESDTRTEEQRMYDALKSMEEADRVWQSDRLHERDPRHFDLQNGDLCEYGGIEYYYSAVDDEWHPIRETF